MAVCEKTTDHRRLQLYQMHIEHQCSDSIIHAIKIENQATKTQMKHMIMFQKAFEEFKQKDAGRGGSGEASRDSVMSRNWQVS